MNSDSDTLASHEDIHVIIVGERFGFPFGSGASARVFSYAKMLLKERVSVSVYCMNYTEKNHQTALNIDKDGVYDGIRFEYLCGSPIRCDQFLQRRLHNIMGRILSVKRIMTEKPKPIAVIGYTKGLINMLILSIASRLRGVNILFEMCEITYKTETSSKVIRAIRRIRYLIVSMLADGFIAISDFMVDYIKNYYTKHKPIIQVPILVDVERFRCGKSVIKNCITYLGNLDRIQEIEQLLEIYAIVARKHSDVRLHVIGNTNTKNLNKLKEYASKLDAESMIQWMGAVNRNLIPFLLGESAVLVLPRNHGLFSLAGFPTKLGEYLASGRPIVVSDVGEIGKYIIDKTHGYIIEPGNIKEFADTISMLLENREHANRIGRNGRELALSSFELHQHSKRLVEFIKNMRDNSNKFSIKSN